MDIKETIRDAEEAIEEILDQLETTVGVRAFRINIIGQRGYPASVTITPDDKGGRKS